MNENYTREIDLIDLFIDWLAHWKSLLAFVIIGVLVAGCYMYMGRGGVESTVAVKDTLASSGTLSNLSEEQLSAADIKDLEGMLAPKDLLTVKDVVELNEEYIELQKAYQSDKDNMSVSERSEALSNLATAKNIIETRKSALTADQLVYYNYCFGAAGMDRDSYDENSTVTVVSASASSTKAALIIIFAIVLHFIICSCNYIFNNKIKHTDSLTAMVNVPEYTRMIDWTALDSKKGLDALVGKMRFSGIRRTDLAETLEINAVATADKLKNKNYSSVAVVGTGLDEERKSFTEAIAKAAVSATVKSIDSVTHSVNGADEIADVDAAILAVKVAQSRYNDFVEELQSLRDRDVDVIGIAIFE